MNKILIVDDFATMRRIIKNFLKNMGYRDIYEAENGKEAMKMLSEGGFDLVLTDWNMPVMNGLELLQSIRASELHSHIPVLMLTAESKREQIVRAAQEGVNGYIVKPFNEITLKIKLEKIFERIGRPM
jgi:two-component system chemotaxis response regulator CheY